MLLLIRMSRAARRLSVLSPVPVLLMAALTKMSPSPLPSVPLFWVVTVTLPLFSAVVSVLTWMVALPTPLPGVKVPPVLLWPPSPVVPMVIVAGSSSHWPPAPVWTVAVSVTASAWPEVST